MSNLIQVEGYKAFRGTMRITPKAAVPAFELTGDWLYRPDTGYWYGKGSSFHPDICTIVQVAPTLEERVIALFQKPADAGREPVMEGM